jgi:hypothetical protein
MTCTHFRPDHNGECLTCDEPIWEHSTHAAPTRRVPRGVKRYLGQSTRLLVIAAHSRRRWRKCAHAVRWLTEAP